MIYKMLLTVTAAAALSLAGCGEKKAEESAEGEAEAPAAEKGETGTKPDSKPDDGIPDHFAVKLETTQGDVIIDVHKEWAPLGAERFHELVSIGYYNDAAFFRVLDGFMAQTGINADPEMNKKWRKNRIKDDPVTQSNQRGTLSFATGGPNSRTTQFFINYGNNAKLDKMGFSPFGEVRDMGSVDKLYSEYGEGAPRGRGPSQMLVQTKGKAYLEQEFPKLDYIKTATFLKE